MATDPNDPTTIEHQPVVDRVVEVSKYPDGSPAQNAGYEVVDDEEAAGEEPDVQQVSGVVASQQEQSGGTTRRRRSKNTETAAER